MTQLENDLRERLIEELSEYGRNAVSSLEAAQAVLDAGVVAPRIGRTIACDIRSSMNEIPDAADVADESRWEKASREAVSAYKRYRERENDNTSDTTEELRDLNVNMVALDRLHSELNLAENASPKLYDASRVSSRIEAKAAPSELS